MTVLLMLATFGVFIAFDAIFGKKPIVKDDREFDHSQDGFAGLGVTMADGGEKI